MHARGSWIILPSRIVFLLKVRCGVVVFLTLLGVPILSQPVVLVHGLSGGLVCLANAPLISLPSNACPAAPGPTFNGPSGQLIRIGVYVNGSASFDGFDIVLQANSSFLKPVSADLAKTIFQGPMNIALECIGTTNLTSSTCDPAVDTPDTLRLRVTGQATASVSSGLLFNAVFNITGTTGSAISVGFSSRCGVTSVVGGVCVTLSSGGYPVSESVQGASFNNAVPPPYLVSSSVGQVGPMILNSTKILRINLYGQNGWGTSNSPSIVFLTSTEDSSLNIRLTPFVPVKYTGVGSGGMNVTGTRAGNFSAVISAEYSTYDPQYASNDTLVDVAALKVIVADFSLSINPMTGSTVLAGQAYSSQVTVTSVNGFSGIVSLSTNASAGECSLSPSSLAVVASNSSTLSCRWDSAGNRSLAVVGAVGSDIHRVGLGFSVQDFSISTTSGQVSLAVGSSAVVTLSLLGLNGFDQSVTISIDPPIGLTITPLRTVVVPPASVVLTFEGGSPGNYQVNVTISSGAISHFIIVRVSVGSSSSLFGLSPILFYSIVAVIGGLVSTAIAFTLRGKKTGFQGKNSQKQKPV